ncbi:hypothetical protein SAMN06298226_2719 [Nitrosovibrio sp. Nv4]|nr:hypothetical protein SAMN06298226_2719 [Nitrosovibrio sp. Nv4]
MEGVIKFPVAIVRRAIELSANAHSMFQGRAEPVRVTTSEILELVLEWRIGEKKLAICLSDNARRIRKGVRVWNGRFREAVR